MGTFQRGRHAPAFILILLTDGPAYGLELLEKIDEMVPGNKMEKAVLYRNLGKLEKEGKVTVRLDDSRSGPVRKYYTITDNGYEALDEFYIDISQRVKNLNIFMKKYNSITHEKGRI